MYRLTYSGPPTSVALFILIAADSAYGPPSGRIHECNLVKQESKPKRSSGSPATPSYAALTRKFASLGSSTEPEASWVSSSIWRPPQVLRMHFPRLSHLHHGEIEGLKPLIAVERKI